MRPEPPVAGRLVGIELVEHDVDLALPMGGDDAVHEVEELTTSAAFVVAGADLAGDDIEGGEQRRRAVPL